MALSEREAGDVLRRLTTLEEVVKEMRTEVRTVDGKVDGILSRFDTMDGGWKMLMFIGGIAGTIGAGITALAIKLWPLLFGTLPKI